MCFRPADASVGNDSNIPTCPECGKPLQIPKGVDLERCPFCKCDFTPYLDGSLPLPSKAQEVPRASSMPKAPGAPKAPMAPKAPQMPKAPTA